MKKALLFGAAALMLVGAGCNNTTTPAPKSKSAGDAPATTPATETPMVESATTTVVAGLTLTGESKGNKVVHLSFTTPENMDKDIEGYRLLMGREADPTPATATDWYSLGSAHREKDWTVRATGLRHFRVCVVKANQCTSYSNDLDIEVK